MDVAGVRAALDVRPGRMFVGGEWVDGEGPRFEQLHPATNTVMADFPEAGTVDVDAAVAAARSAFDDGPWPRMPAQDRKRILQPVVERIYDHADELDRLQTLDNGVPYALARVSRVSARAAAHVFDHFAGWVDKINGETFPQFTDASNMHYLSYRDPVGVVAAVLPFNGPMLTFAMKVGTALACGCTVVVKPSEYTNLAVTRLVEILAGSDLPPGVLNLVTGAGETGAALTSHPGVDKVTFTGSSAVGESIMVAGAPTMKRLSLELGGKSAGIVFPDCRSVQRSAATLMGLCSTFLSGQICSTPTRAVVHASIVDEFVEHATDQVKRVRFGDPFDPATTSAPLISRRQQRKVLDYVHSGVDEGARLEFGGDAPGGGLADGNWVEPALFTGVTRDMRVVREEIFGPVLCVLPFESEDDAVRIANDSAYGLAGAVYTTDISRGVRVARAVRSGSIGINNYASVPNAPMGGVGRSGVGREGGWASIEAFTELKTINIDLDG